jgi:hypothetical protein
METAFSMAEKDNMKGAFIHSPLGHGQPAAHSLSALAGRSLDPERLHLEVQSERFMTGMRRDSPECPTKQ